MPAPSAPVFALRGDIVYSKTPTELAVFEDHWLVCENGRVAGVFAALPERWAAIPRHEHTGRLIVPGLIDLHLHAPQYSFRALGMDLELLDWLEANTFPEEAKFANEAYAERAYRLFTDALVAGGTTRACVFGTVHVPATLRLMDMLEESGLVAYVGKVNMDRNAPAALCEESAAASLQSTREWLAACAGRYTRTRPMLTPRFLPSCSNEAMAGLSALQKEHGLPVQSHLSENPSEMEWVKQLCPDAGGYADAYLRRGLFGGEGCPTVMAHCVYVTDDEMALMAQRGVFAAHCASSNTNLASGIAPVRALLEAGVPVGLGSDVAGGFTPCLFRAAADSVQVSKLRWRLLDEGRRPLTVPEAFYLATRGGGAFFGRVGAFEAGFAFDALVLDDADLPTPLALTPAQRLERFVYLAQDNMIREKYAGGLRVK